MNFDNMIVSILYAFGLKTPIHDTPKMQNALPWAETRHMTYRSSKSVHTSELGARRRIKLNKKGRLIDQNMTCHVFAETTHVVAAPYGFACVVLPLSLIHI